MNAQHNESRAAIRLILLAGALGLVSGVITFAFVWVVEKISSLLWTPVEGLEGWLPKVLTFVICVVGGIVVGILVRIFGDHSGIFAELMQKFGRTGRFDYRHAPGIVVTALISLVAGGSLGPEAPMADACGGIGTLTADKLKMGERGTRAMGFSGMSGMLGAFITSPFGGAVLSLESARSGVSPLTLFPSLVSAAAATIVFVLLSGSFFGSLYVFPEYAPHVTDLLLAIPIGLAGAAAGAVFMVSFAQLRRLMEPLRKHVILRGAVGGVGMGVAGVLLPLTLFSGQEQTLTLIERAATLGILYLVAVAVVKVVVTSLLLATGWKGGYIFPIMFAGVALGMAIHHIFPAIPEAVAVAAAIAGGMVATMKAPLFAGLITLIIVQREAAAVIAIAVIVGWLATTRFSMVPAAPAGATEVPEGISSPEKTD
jgi:H+/Cl- antiporter ClcA